MFLCMHTSSYIPIRYCVLHQDASNTGERCTKETIILEPTSPVTHFIFNNSPHEDIKRQHRENQKAKKNDSPAPALRELPTTADGDRVDVVGDQWMRLDRFRHIPGCLVCRGNLGHVKVKAAIGGSCSGYSWFGIFRLILDISKSPYPSLHTIERQ